MIIDSFVQSISKFTINKQNIQIARSLIKKNKIVQKKLSSHITINNFYFFVSRNDFWQICKQISHTSKTRDEQFLEISSSLKKKTWYWRIWRYEIDWNSQIVKHERNSITYENIFFYINRFWIYSINDIFYAIIVRWKTMS